MSDKASCMICEDPIDIWKDELVEDAYQKDGCNHYTYTCPDCGITNTHSIPYGEEAPAMTFESMIFALDMLMFGEPKGV